MMAKDSVTDLDCPKDSDWAKAKGIRKVTRSETDSGWRLEIRLVTATD